MNADLPRPSAVLMGPQRLAPIVDQALSLLGVDGRVAVITAGWQEREPEDDELKDALGGRQGVNLLLHARGEAAYNEDAELFEQHRAKQDKLKRLQELYRRRLGHVMAAAEDMYEQQKSDLSLSSELVEPQLAGAMEWVRMLDDEHASQVREINRGFNDALQPLERAAVKRERDQVLEILESCSAVAIAGGHVAVLLNKLELFAMAEPLARLPIVAWSAGAMVMTDRVVLFHDTPPQGRGYAEAMSDGLGILPGVVVLPHARRRLLLDDRERISLFARRFMPHTCVTLDERCYIAYYQGSLGSGMWRANDKARRLDCDGTCVAMEGP